jgi:aspartate/methionine/tyrosine aminotransferase
MNYDRMLSERARRTPGSGIREIYNIAIQVKGLINFCIGDPDFRTPENVCDAAKKSIDDGYTHYTPNAGYEDLRIAIAQKLARENNIHVDPQKEVMVTTGAQGALCAIMLAFVDPGDRVLIPDPGYVCYRSQVLMTGGTPVSYPLSERNNFAPNPDDIHKRITKKTKMIVLNSPSNPLGSVIHERELVAIANIARDHDLMVVTDEAYERLVYDKTKHISICSLSNMKERTLSVFSCSKTYAMTGWRIGYVVGEEMAIREMTKLQEHICSHPTSISQKAALTALSSCEDFVLAVVEEFSKRRELIVKMLNEIEGIHCLMPEGAFYVFPNVSAFNMTSADLAKFLIKEAKIAVVPGREFGINGEGHIRLSYALSYDKIQEGVDRMKQALSKIPRRLS